MKSDRTDLGAEEAWRIYHLLTRAENAFRCMKSPLAERPIFQQVQRRVEILTTREAAALLSLSPSMLQRYRVKGGGPRYLQIGGTVRYARVDLLWVLTKRQDGAPEE